MLSLSVVHHIDDYSAEQEGLKVAGATARRVEALVRPTRRVPPLVPKHACQLHRAKGPLEDHLAAKEEEAEEEEA